MAEPTKHVGKLRASARRRDHPAGLGSKNFAALPEIQTAPAGNPTRLGTVGRSSRPTDHSSRDPADTGTRDRLRAPGGQIRPGEAAAYWAATMSPPEPPPTYQTWKCRALEADSPSLHLPSSAFSSKPGLAPPCPPLGASVMRCVAKSGKSQPGAARRKSQQPKFPMPCTRIC